MKMIKQILILFLVSVATQVSAQNVLRDPKLKVLVGDDGIVQSFKYHGQRGETEVSFRKDDYLKGPSLFFNEKRLVVSKAAAETNAFSFIGETDTLSYKLTYNVKDGAFIITAAVSNKLNVDLSNPIITLKPGVNTELAKYPAWNYIFFPTLLRCEKTHFWGYIQNGVGDVLAMGTEEPVASWQMEYYEPTHWRGYGGHLIYGYRLDLMHQLPLPVRHPQDLTLLKAGETKTWNFYLKPVKHLDQVKSVLATTINAPMIDAELYTVPLGETTKLTVMSDHRPQATLLTPKGKNKKVKLISKGKGNFEAECTLNDGIGVYVFRVKDVNGKVSEASLSTRQNYTWYMDKARDASVKYGQYASSHLETWLGLHSGLLAQKYSANPEVDKAIEDRLNLILSLQWDETTLTPKNMYEMRKVANSAQMISVLVDAYEATSNMEYLEKARHLSVFIMSRQYEHGDYENYSAIFYPVKSMMELLYAEQDFLDDSTWKLYYTKQYNSVKRAIDYLVESLDNIKTEGQQTFEDGMISCSASQISMFALLQEDPKLRAHYTEAARIMTEKHRSLEQAIIPDSRMNGGSIRFWEAQYDILETKKWNLINSPHGWSAWRLYGTWYMYLLTGEEEYLLDLTNAIGSCIQLVDGNSGTLRWAFAADPYCEVALMVPAASGELGCADTVETVVGEQYMNMITDFYYPETPETIVYGYKRVRGWSCNNDVHEVFKCMEETSLRSAYVLERKDGSLLAINCELTDSNGVLRVTPKEKVVKAVHFNLKKKYTVNVLLDSGAITQDVEGMGWIGDAPYAKGLWVPELEPKRLVRGENY